jgi:hypothetical protein
MEVRPEVNADKSQVPPHIDCLVTTMQNKMAMKMLNNPFRNGQSSVTENDSDK